MQHAAVTKKDGQGQTRRPSKQVELIRQSLIAKPDPKHNPKDAPPGTWAHFGR